MPHRLISEKSLTNGSTCLYTTFIVQMRGDVLVSAHGGVAQLGARLNGIEKVWGSNPHTSIIFSSCTNDSRRPPQQSVSG